MRLFIAVNFNDQVKKWILDIQGLLRAQSTRGNFTRPENLHLTLVFIGESPEEKLNKIFKIMDEIELGSFEISFSHTGCFTHSSKELWWIGVERSCPGLLQLEAIHTQLLDRLLTSGFNVDNRPFNAHITLGREIKRLGPIVLNCPKITVKVNRISLMKSEHIRGILTYTELMGQDLRADK